MILYTSESMNTVCKVLVYILCNFVNKYEKKTHGKSI